jgi:hypothetical protein
MTGTLRENGGLGVACLVYNVYGGGSSALLYIRHRQLRGLLGDLGGSALGLCIALYIRGSDPRMRLVQARI